MLVSKHLTSPLLFQGHNLLTHKLVNYLKQFVLFLIFDILGHVNSEVSNHHC